MLHRRQFLRHLGVSAAALPFLAGLPSLTGAPLPQRRQRVVIMFSPNGTLPKDFWPDATAADLTLKPILQPLEPFKDRTADAQRHLQQGSRRRRQSHARHELPAHRQRTAARQHPRRRRQSGRLGGRHFDRPGDQEFPPEPARDADALWLAGVRRRGAGSRRSVDAHELRGAESARSRRWTIRIRCSASSTAG